MDRARYLIGILTLLLALAGGSFLVNLLSDEDQSLYFRLNVEYRNVEGLLPGADVKYRGVRVGSVRRVALRDDGGKGVAIIALNPGQEHLARTNSRFWIVTPRFGGLASGATGLETLVRDAYVSFLTPRPWGPRMANGSSVPGWETPFVDESDTAMPPPRRGDLQMTLLVPENYGLVPTSKILFRGVVTGEVREVSLAPDGTHVRLKLLIDRLHRRSVTDRTKFWVARPGLSGGLMGGMALHDVSAILSPFVSYYTEPGEGLPVPEGYLVAAEVQRPGFELTKVSTAGMEPQTNAIANKLEKKAVQLVQVIYEAIEEDWLSADDHIRREGTGVLFEERDGRLMVLTARSACDASYFERDMFGGAPDVIKEGIRVVLADGTALRAMLTWAAAGGRDLALLRLDFDGGVQDAPPVTPPELLWFGHEAKAGEALESRVFDADGGGVGTPLAAGEPPSSLDGVRGAVVLSEGSVIGVLGQTAGTDTTPKIESIDLVPEPLRPRT